MMAVRSPFLSFLGRVLFSFLFLSSGLQKLQSFDPATGGPIMSAMAPKMDAAINVVQNFLGKDIAIEKELYVYFLGVAIFLELAGAGLFIFNYDLGAWFLLAFTLAVTPVMHNFWDEQEGSQTQIFEMVQFFKNISLAGALLFFLGGRPKK